MSDSETQTAAGPNAAEIEYWNGDVGRRWTLLQEQIDALFAPLTEAAIDHAAPQAGEGVLDIGCGCGATVLDLAGRVGSGGRVLGVDVSKPMLDVAEQRTRDLRHVELVVADASTHSFGPDFDLVFSRFGVMFFDDPVRAFANIRRALRPGGRLAFVAWRRLSDNSWFLAPFLAAKPHLPPQPPADPEAPGPFAFADPDRVRRVLEGAGFSDIVLKRHDSPMRLAGPGETAQAANFATKIGPVSRAMTTAEPAAVVAAKAAIRDDLAEREGPDGIVLAGGIWLVSARA